MAKQLLGKEVNADLNQQIIDRVNALKEKGVTPTLGIIRVGEKDADLSYERGATKRCEKLGVEYRKFVFPEDVSQEELMGAIDQVNKDQSIHGVLIFRPLPKTLDEKAVIAALDPEKDIDGITDGSMVGVYTGQKKGFPPCTAQAVMEILRHYQYDLKGKKAVVIGRSLVIGKPVAMMLLKENATVTICHTKTKDMAAEAREADLLVVAAGHRDVVDESFVKAGQTVIDVGINVNEEGKLCGDVSYDKVEPVVDAITPVPGGVGSVTTSVLVSHVVEAAERSLKK
ncbi:MAG: tetrahydrofolate dehydrogenase/cyclohydrolase catalytic domain-containing protein [Bilifractor sp.]|jgi:methylenetetrahydrofolate dehydrogenase (NADP+)/methenyltetrahydrofolate cyclohydrolase|nr:bifunctional 5,10-methylene-tetrahydrofolate dehydrogenase/5,10-methylene-tetrahydrofolate cyclohydrolase [Lachnospiraceae bacterium]MDY2837541.1 tetrahydrofolate dehydrogenase/cyclohydrolase catalytic domain-containing protein [Bilifractor sp.]